MDVLAALVEDLLQEALRGRLEELDRAAAGVDERRPLHVLATLDALAVGDALRLLRVEDSEDLLPLLDRRVEIGDEERDVVEPHLRHGHSLRLRRHDDAGSRCRAGDSGSTASSASSSASLGGGVSAGSSTCSANPVAATTSSTDTPGWTLSSRGPPRENEITQRSVTSFVGAERPVAGALDPAARRGAEPDHAAAAPAARGRCGRGRSAASGWARRRARGRRESARSARSPRPGSCSPSRRRRPAPGRRNCRVIACRSAMSIVSRCGT